MKMQLRKRDIRRDFDFHLLSFEKKRFEKKQFVPETLKDPQDYFIRPLIKQPRKPPLNALLILKLNIPTAGREQRKWLRQYHPLTCS